MSAAVMACWTMALAAGLLGTRRLVGALTAATALAALATQPQLIGSLAGWLQLAVCAGGPWLLVDARKREEAARGLLQAEESSRKISLSESAQMLLGRQQDVRMRESRLARLGEIYRVTKDTAAALHIGELFSACLQSAGQLLEARGLRLVDGSQEPPAVYRALRSPDGRLLAQAPADGKASAEPDPMERIVLQRVRASSAAGEGTAQSLGCALPPGVESLAWAPLGSEPQPSAVLIAEQLPPSQADLLSAIVKQLSLQLARIRLYRQVEALAVTDALTGLSVRGYLLQRAQEEVERSRRHRLACTLLMVDLDFFKQKNDTYGHLVGDVVLKEVARLLQRNLREVDLIGRYGGEEMILLLIETTVDQAMPIAQRLKQLVELHPIRAYDELLTQTVSIGVAGFPEDARTLEALIERADEALYAAKHAGRNRVMRWSSQLEPGQQKMDR